MIESNSDELKKVVSPLMSPKNLLFENKLRPKNFSNFIGQSQVKKNLEISIKASNKRSEPLDHILLHGAPGLGKTTLAFLIASEKRCDIKITSGPALERQGDLASIISNLNDNDVLFIDEIHRLKPVIEEILYSAMEDFGIDIIVGKGPSARNMRINLPRFTLIGATTKMSLLSSPLRARFGNVFKLLPYSDEDITKILLQSADILKCKITDEAASLLSKSCRNTPRIANRLLRRTRDLHDAHDHSVINEDIVNQTLKNLGVDCVGLDQMDRELLKIIIEKFEGGPVGLNTLSAAITEEQATIEDIYEPFLIKLGFLQRTSKGRIATKRAYSHLSTPISV